MLELMTAIYSRWAAAGLNSSIGNLYPAGESKSGRNATGSPVATELPRAEYEVHRGPPQIKTRNSRTYQAVAVIRVYCKASDTTDGSTLVTTYLQTIFGKFVNSNQAVSNPLVMANGDILEVDDGGQGSAKADDDVWVGVQTLLIRHRVNNRAAS